MAKHYAIAGILVLAALLRFTALDAGLRHQPIFDEQVFVENVRGMLARGDLQPRFYEYPGLTFYLLWPALFLFGERAVPAARNYELARGVVAVFGVISVALVYRLGTRLFGTAAGLFAALLLAVSPVEVFTAHSVRPDVILEAFVLLSLLAFTRIGAEPRADAWSGATLGLAVAVKFTGVLLAPTYVLQRLLSPGGRWWRLVLAGGLSLVVFVLCSPFTLLDLPQSLAGIQTQVSYHYIDRVRPPEGFVGMAGLYGRILVNALGPVALALIPAGLVLSRHEWRRWVPLLALPLVTVAVFSTSEVRHDRFMVPTLGVLALFAGLGVRAVVRHGRVATVAAAAAAAAPPLVASVDYVRGISVPSTYDRALDWVEGHAVDGSRVMTTVSRLGLDRRRYEVTVVDGFDRTRVERVMPELDLLVARQEDVQRAFGLRELRLFEPPNRHAGPPLVVATALPIGYCPVPIRPEWLSASENPSRVAAVADDDLGRMWETEGPQKPGTWIQVDLPSATPLARIDLLLGHRVRDYGGDLRLYTQSPGGPWSSRPIVPGRPPVRDQLGNKAGSASQVLLLLEPAPAVRVRIVSMARRLRPWAVAQLRLFADQRSSASCDRGPTVLSSNAPPGAPCGSCSDRRSPPEPARALRAAGRSASM